MFSLIIQDYRGMDKRGINKIKMIIANSDIEGIAGRKR